jgi:hypothetical protein
MISLVEEDLGSEETGSVEQKWIEEEVSEIFNQIMTMANQNVDLYDENYINHKSQIVKYPFHVTFTFLGILSLRSKKRSDYQAKRLRICFDFI